ncbi:MAG: cyanophycinase [Frankiales bacterium]|nr:cyanophycinase [Frankiales bacterium]
MTGPLALVGSGEYLPVLEDVERDLLAGRPPRFVQLATAAAPEGAASLARWHDLGLRAAERLGVEQVVVPVVDRTTADDPALAALVDGAGLVYLSGGSPPFLAATLRGTAVWRAVHRAWQGGTALAGCSAGAMALTDHVPDLRHPLRPAQPGLGAVPHLRVLPHFDRFAAWLPDVVLTRVVDTPPGVTVVGIDEDTALVGGPHVWQVRGRQSVWVLTADGRTEHAAGSTLTTAGPSSPG